MVDTGDSGGNDPHCDTGHSGIAQAIAQIQCSDNDAQNWDAEVLNCVLAQVLDEDQIEASVTNGFAVFVIANGIDNVCLLLTLLDNDLKLMGHDIDFKTFHHLTSCEKDAQ